MIIAGKEIKRIVASGCSFTYGYGLEDRATQTWVAHLSNMCDFESVNLGKGGHGNEHVQNSLIDYFAKNNNHLNDTLVICCFSSYSRVEFPVANATNDHKTFATLYNHKIFPEFSELFFNKFFSSKYYYMRYMRTIISLQMFLNHFKVPYLMFEGISGNPHKVFDNDTDVQLLVDMIDQSKWLGFREKTLDNQTDPKERLFDGHPNANAYRQMAEILYKHIINTYETE